MLNENNLSLKFQAATLRAGQEVDKLNSVFAQANQEVDELNQAVEEIKLLENLDERQQKRLEIEKRLAQLSQYANELEQSVHVINKELSSANEMVIQSQKQFWGGAIKLPTLSL